jgi:hypothetical protein
MERKSLFFGRIRILKSNHFFLYKNSKKRLKTKKIDQLIYFNMEVILIGLNQPFLFEVMDLNPKHHPTMLR